MPTTDLLQVARETRYPIGAFLFVQRGLDYTVREIHGELHDDGTMQQALDATQAMDLADSPRHVSGRELCKGLRRFAIKEYGLMARMVLRRWGILHSEDFGHIVFHMVDAGIMHKTDEDQLDDFADVYRFEDAFPTDFKLKKLKAKSST